MAPAGDGSGGGRSEDGPPVVVAIVGSRLEAHLIVGLLTSNGFAADIATDDAGGQEPQLQQDGVRVVVAASEEEAARRLLADVEQSPGEDGED